MWEGLKGIRLKNGALGLFLGVIMSSILLFASFYIYFLYLLIPVLLVIVFHYSKSWRFSDRAFYGFVVIVISFFIAVSGISYTLVGEPPHSEVIYQLNGTSYDIHFNYAKLENDYIIYFSIPANNISQSINVTLINLFTGGSFANYSLSMVKNGSVYYVSKDIGPLSAEAYVLNFTFFSKLNNTSVAHSVEFLGPVLVPVYVIILEFGKSLLITYLIITYIFFLIFAYFARTIANAKKRSPRNKEISIEKKDDENKNN